MSKDQAMGAVILVISILLIGVYIWWLFFSPWDWEFAGWHFREWALILPVLLLVLAVLGVAAWIGYTMASTPPPKPLEDISEISEPVQKKEGTEKEAPKEEKK